MAFFTRPRLDNLQFQQQSSDNLTLSGSTIFSKTIGGISLYDDQSDTIIPIDASNPFDGAALIYSGGTLIFRQGGGGGAAFLDNVGGGSGLIYNAGSSTGATSNLRTISGGSGVVIETIGDTIVVNASGGLLGKPNSGLVGDQDDDYDDGLFPFTSGTTVGKAVDDINEFLGLLAPAQPPILDNQNTLGGFVEGKLSFGATKNDIGYANVTAGQTAGALDINDNFPIVGFRKGLTQNSILTNNNIFGVLNDDVAGNETAAGVPFEENAFRDGSVGTLSLYLNGIIIDVLDLFLTDNAIDGLSGYLSVGQAKAVKFDNGNDFGGAKYRQGDFTIPTSLLRDGYNYVRVIHSDGSNFTRTTNFTDWVYDDNTENIDFVAVNNGATFESVNLSGSRLISGVEYYTSGNVVYEGTASNVYKNVYSNSTTAIRFLNRINLASSPSSILVSGAGIVNGSNTALPNLNTNVQNPQDTLITISATLDINTDRVLGRKNFQSAGSLPSGELRSSINVLHPFNAKAFNKAANITSSEVSETGVLLYNVNQTSNSSSENFTGEIYRLKSRNYSGTLYSNLLGGLYNWESSLSLIGTNAEHNTGMLVFNGGLYYPNSSELNSDYNIINGNFDSLTYSPANNVNYTSASGIRNYYRKFSATTTTALATIQGGIVHDGDTTTFLTNPATQGTPTANRIKFEVLIKRVDGSSIGYMNPFSTDFASQSGVSNVTLSQSGRRTNFSFTLGQGRVDNGDIIIVRLFFSPDYNQKINLIEFTNIN